MAKKSLGINVYEAAKQRIAWTFDTFPHIYVSFSGGKDSSVMLHLVMDEAIKRNREVGILFIDLEGQYKMTIDYILQTYEEYHLNARLFWIALPIHLRNAVSQYQPDWICWDPKAEEQWIRRPPSNAITDQNYFPFYTYAMEFEEFIEYFGDWYGKGELTACLVGIRSDESLNRYRTIAREKQCIEGKKWTTYMNNATFNVYPIYDWKTQDIWTYNGKFKKSYNHLYDYMFKAGLSIHQARICQPYGDDQRKGLWLFHVIEPETWKRVVARVNGANQGALYARESGNILGMINITKPPGHTWQSFAMLLLDSMPERTAEHFKNKIAVCLKWWADHGQLIYDDGPLDKGYANWKRICKALLRNDYWCKGLSFSQHKSTAYSKYLKIMKKRRNQWGIFPIG